MRRGRRITRLKALGGAVGAGLLVVSAAVPAQEDGHWRVRIGVGRIDFHEALSFRIGGQPVAGASASVEDNTTLLAEIGYRLTRHWSANLTLGIPPNSKVEGAGTAAPFGRLGTVKYGPIALTAQYQFDGLRGLRPYAGAGPVHYAVFKSSDGSVAGLDVDNAWGALVQAGVEYQLSAGIAAFLDFRKLYLKTDARGTLPALGGAPITARAVLDPTVMTVGLALRF